MFIPDPSLGSVHSELLVSSANLIPTNLIPVLTLSQLFTMSQAVHVQRENTRQTWNVEILPLNSSYCRSIRLKRHWLSSLSVFSVASLLGSFLTSTIYNSKHPHNQSWQMMKFLTYHLGSCWHPFTSFNREAMPDAINQYAGTTWDSSLTLSTWFSDLCDPAVEQLKCADCR